jgi:hypothetical protein
MADIDDFATSLLEEAKRFLEKAVEAAKAADDVRRNANLHASLMLAFCSLEAHVNAIAAEFSGRPELTTHDKGILLEREVRLEGREFTLGGFRMYRLEDRILFLHRRFSGKSLDKSVAWWPQLKSAIHNRNKLTHPKGAHPVTVKNVRDALAAVIASLDALYKAIYKKGLPAANLALHSLLTF